MHQIRNIFACLVHENRECVIDLVRNLRALDPASLILLYNGGPDRDLLNHSYPFERHGAVIHPAPRPAAWGRLHQFALDCMEWALENHPFDTLTIVDSDQLSARAGYPEYLARHLESAGNIGLLGNSSIVQTAGTRIGPAEVALRETELWRPLLRQFPRGEAKYPHWCFWPSTVFLADAARDLTTLFKTNQQLRSIMERTRIWATEELILPTLVSLLGYEVAASPCSYDFVQYRVAYTPQHVEAALRREDVFWIHPVPRRYDDPLRRLIRERLDHYGAPSAEAGRAPDAALPHLFLTLPIIEKMRAVEGWLEDAEAELLIAALTRAIATCPGAPAVVEIGSYCGRSTVVLGRTALAADPSGTVRIHAIDPHDGIVGAADRGLIRTAPTLEKFRRSICQAGLGDRVESIPRRPSEVEWSQPICLLLIDGLHDYTNVARDFHQFAPWVEPGGLVAFHDYASYWPGVKMFVDELLAGEFYEKVNCAGSMMVVRKTGRETEARAARPARAAEPERTPAPAVLTGQPMVSCIMATADRRALVPQAIRYFERQDYSNKELIVLDDGADPIADLIPPDGSIRYVRVEPRRTMGAKHNAGCEMARGEIVVHWDDDDWMAPWRLSYQVENLLSQPRETLSGLSRLFFWDPRASSAWEYIYPNAERPWVCGGTFCYRKQFWETHRHPDMNEGADTVFVWGLHGANIVPLSNHQFYVALVHPRNTSPKRTNTSGWHAFPVGQVRQLVAADVSFYEDAGRPLVPY